MRFDFKRCLIQTVAVICLAGAPFLGIVAARGEGASARPDLVTGGRLVLAEPRLVVIKSRRLLYLYDGGRLVRTYPVALGSEPTGQKQYEGDGRTPEGSFRIVRINAQSRYCRFFGIDYPDRPAARRGLAEGVISAGEAAAILDALDHGQSPIPWTPLGGGIGIHGGTGAGTGAGDGAGTNAGGERGQDWTAGCVALSDEHVEELYQVLRVGDPVEILP